MAKYLLVLVALGLLAACLNAMIVNENVFRKIDLDERYLNIKTEIKMKSDNLVQ